MDFYAQAATTVLDLISKFGTTASIRRLEKAYNSTTGETTEFAKVTGTLKALVLPIATTPKALAVDADNKLVEGIISGKLRYIFAAAKGASFEPEPNDILILSGESYTALGSAPLSPAGTPLLYRIIVMRTPSAPLDETATDVESVEHAAHYLDDVVDGG